MSPHFYRVPGIHTSDQCPRLAHLLTAFYLLFLANLVIMEHAAALREALSENGDIELRFQGGHSIPVHSLKLKLASSFLNEMITATLDDQIASAAAKRRKTADGGSTAAGQDMPYVQVSNRHREDGIIPAMGCMGGCDHSTMHSCPPQVDGAYEDWVEVLRLIYHSGGS